MGTKSADRAAEGDSELKSRLAAIVESSTDAIISATLDGVITAWNAGAVDMYGYTADEVLGRNVSRLFPPGRADELVSIFDRLRQGERVQHFETQRVRKDGTIIDVSVSVSPIRDASGSLVGAANVTRDISQSKREEARRRQSERMETVGQLAGGIAHDFNNLLGVIVGYADLVATATADDPAVRADVQQIQAAAERAAGLTKELLIFSRREPTQPEKIDLNVILADMRDLLSASVGSHVTVRFQTAADLPPVAADRGQMEQLLLNLAVNARDAMPQGGTLTITTGQAQPARRRSAAGPGAGPGKYVELTVGDTGCGMSAEVRRRAFEPFFSTKPLGQGTGLGLSAVYGIVAQAGGSISIDSEEHMGTTMHIYWPAIPAPAPAPPPAPPAPAVRGSGQTILVVDDEPAVLAVTARILRSHGYRTVEASTCDEALSLLSSCDCQLMVTDSVMPGMAGPELARHALERKPGLRVLHMSGSTAGLLDPDRVFSGDATFIQKPFTSLALLRKVRRALEPLPVR
jgi:PAS domain S-box-containing protein